MDGFMRLACLLAHTKQQQSPKNTALQQSCNACHDDYQAITALTYRTLDFSGIQIFNITKPG
ncbi:hypothetical protein CMT41_02630 [Colwellia sp. MT41]|nr:hypothetical protein CMT41_02630 [Colwellia sp. MT41]